MIRYRVLLLVGLGLTINNCSLFQKAPTTGAIPEDVQGKAARSATNSGLNVVDRITKPTISRDQSFLKVSTPEGLHTSIDMRQLLDVDNSFKPIGDDPDLDRIAPVLTATIENLFEMGYYDVRRSSLGQADINRLMASVKLSKPIWVGYSHRPGFYVINTMAFNGGHLLGVAAVTQDEKGKLEGSGVEFASTTKGLPLVSEVLPALPRTAAFRALGQYAPGFNIQSSEAAGLERIKVRSRVQMVGYLDYCWQAKASSQPYLVGSRGDLYRYQLPLGVQSLSAIGGGKAILTKVGKVPPVTADFAGLSQ